MQPPKRNVFFVSLLIIVSTLVTIFTIELFLRWETAYDSYSYSTVEIGGREYQFQDSIDSILTDNADGVAERIYLVGDSFVAGVECAAKGKNLPGHLQTLMGDRFDVVNLGVRGKDPSNYIDFLNYFPITSNDKVIIVLYRNDVFMSRETCELTLEQGNSYDLDVPASCVRIIASDDAAAHHKGLLYHFDTLMRKSRFLTLVKEGTYNVGFLRDYFYRSQYNYQIQDLDSEESRWLRSTVPVMKNIVQSKGAEFWVTYYPDTANIVRDSHEHMAWLLFKEEVLQDIGIYIHDPYYFFLENAPGRKMVWSLTDKHPSCEAHMIMARYLKSLVDSESTP